LIAYGREPSLPFVFRTAKKLAGLQISTVVKTFRDREVPPAAPNLARRQHAIRDRQIEVSIWTVPRLRCGMKNAAPRAGHANRQCDSPDGRGEDYASSSSMSVPQKSFG
jgi:hypothetical protein